MGTTKVRDTTYKSMITRINIQQQNLKIQTQNAGLKTIYILVMLWEFLFYV